MAPEGGSRAPRFRTVVLDVDSTLAGIEGIDWLANRRRPKLAAETAALTNAAMAGEVPLQDVYARRLDLIAPTAHDVAALSAAYYAAVAPGAKECIAAFVRADVRVLVVSGGLREALLPLARDLGVADADVYGVGLRFGADGAYAGFDLQSPLVQSEGKAHLLKGLLHALPRPVLHVGDGFTDAVTRGVVDAFAAYTGFVRREAVVERANFTVESFEGLRALVLG